MIYLPIVLMGITSIILQILFLRQLLSTFSGNELVIGITLAVWLSIVGLGSYIGSKVTIRNAFGISFIFVAVISQPSLIFSKIARPIFGFGLGEVIPLNATIVWTALALITLCLIIGIQFPLAVSYMKGKSPEVYSFEAIGAFMGGVLFTFLVSGRIDSFTVTMIIAIINITVSLYLLRKKVLLLLLPLPLIFYAVGMNILSSLQYKGMKLLNKTESKYSEIVVLEMKDQMNIYSSEKFQFSYPDPQTEELKTHLPMSLHPSAEKILIVGGSPAIIKEFLKYPVSHIDFVEIDPVMIEISKDLLTPADREYLNDRKVKVFHIDARRYIKSQYSPKYDLIVLNIPEPSTANINRFYTKEFFEEARSVLREEGVLYLNLPVSHGYIGRRMQMSNGSIYRSMKVVFPHVEVSSEEYGIFAASTSPLEVNPDVLIARFIEKRIDTKYFHPYVLLDAFSPLQVSMVKGRLGKIKELNRDIRPVSYLYNLMVWAKIHGGTWINFVLGLDEYELFSVIGTILILITLLFIKKGETISYVLFTTGYVTMAFSLIVILAYQAYSGYIYEMIGLLTGTFMFGGAVGAYFARDIQRPLKYLRLFDFLTILVMLMAIPFMKQEFVFYIFIFLAGILGGGQFATSNLSLKEKGSIAIAGKLYAIDLAGSFLGSFLTAIFIVPLTGIHNTILFLISMKALSLILLLRYKK